MLLTVRQVGAEEFSHAGAIFGSPLREGQQHVEILRLHLLQDKHKQGGKNRIGGIYGSPLGECGQDIPLLKKIPSLLHA